VIARSFPKKETSDPDSTVFCSLRSNCVSVNRGSLQRHDVKQAGVFAEVSIGVGMHLNRTVPETDSATQYVL
jgi:hypothetical protein